MPTDPPNTASRVGFGLFELDRINGVLYREGSEVKLQPQPMLILIALTDRAGHDVTREDLRNLLWPGDHFVEFDSSIGTAVRKIRQALGDSLTNPVFVRTLHGQGFRFIAPVYPIEEHPAVPVEATPFVELPPREPRPGHSWLRRVAAATLVAGAVALVILGYRAFHHQTAVHYSIDLPAGQIFKFATGRRVAIARDGGAVAYIADLNGIPQVFIGKPETGGFRPLPGTENALSLGFSPRGDWVIYQEGQELRKISTDGRQAATILSSPSLYPGSRHVWESDDRIYFSADASQAEAPNQRNIYSVPVTGGKVERVIPGPRAFGIWSYPQQLLPGGRELLFSLVWAQQDRVVDSWSFRDRQVRQLMEHATGGIYVSGHLVFTRSGNIMAAPFDIGSMRVTGRTEMVAPDVAFDRYSGSQMAVSETGTIVYFKSTFLRTRQPVWLDFQGHETPVKLAPGRYRLLSLSSDGRKLLLTRFDAGEHWTMWSFGMDNSTWKEIISSDSPNTGGVWSPDGKSAMLAATYRGEHYDNLYLKSVEGGEPARQVTTDIEAGRYPQSWSAAANAIAYTQGYSAGTRRDIYVSSMTPGSKPRCLVCTPMDDVWPEFSPDGKWVAFTSGVSGRNEVYAQSYTGVGAPVRISPDGGENSLWSHSGRELYFRRGDEMWAVGFEPEQRKPQTARRLFTWKYFDVALPWNRDMLLSADGKRFLMLKTMADSPDNRRLQVVSNWFGK